MVARAWCLAWAGVQERWIPEVCSPDCPFKQLFYMYCRSNMCSGGQTVKPACNAQQATARSVGSVMSDSVCDSMIRSWVVLSMDTGIQSCAGWFEMKQLPASIFSRLKILRSEEPRGLRCTESQRVGYDRTQARRKLKTEHLMPTICQALDEHSI